MRPVIESGAVAGEDRATVTPQEQLFPQVAVQHVYRGS